jgi:hypothetical protein
MQQQAFTHLVMVCGLQCLLSSLAASVPEEERFLV